MNFIGVSCPKCNLKFKEKDDIVVCSKCGTPHHRSCYFEKNICVNFDKHKDGFVFGEKGKADKELNEIECKKCFHKNPSNATVCENCKSLINFKKNIKTEQEDKKKSNISENIGSTTDTAFFMKFSSGVSSLSFAGIKPEDKIDNIEIRDFASFIQNNQLYYIMAFKFLENKKINRFNFCAFLFSGFWFLYRKQYKVGIMLTGISVFISILYNILNFFCVSNIQNKIFKQLNISAESVHLLNSEQAFMFYKELFSMPAYNVFLYFVPFILLVLNFSLMLYFGFRANRYYLNHCKKEIIRIKKESDSNCKKNQKFLIEGGVNHHIAWSCIFVLFCIYMICFIF